jgi:hypothetical protein
MRSLVAGIIVGVIVYQIWQALKPKPTSPDKNSSVIDMRAELQRTGTEG